MKLPKIKSAQVFRVQLFSLILFIPIFCLAQTITTTTIPNQLNRNETFCVTIFGTDGDVWVLGDEIDMLILIGDGMTISSSERSCTIEYVPSMDVNLPNFTLSLIYRNSESGLEDDINYHSMTINDPIALTPNSEIIGTNLAPSLSASHTFTLSGGHTEYNATTTAGWSITRSEVNRRQFTISGIPTELAGSFTIPVDFSPACGGGAATTINFTGSVVAASTPVEIITEPASTPGTPIMLPPAMVNRNYPPPGETLPTFSASGGINGDAGGNLHNWSMTPVLTWLGLTPTTSVSQGDDVNFSSTVEASGTPGTISLQVTASDASAGSTSEPDTKSFTLELLPELKLHATVLSCDGELGHSPGGIVDISTITVCTPNFEGTLQSQELLDSNGDPLLPEVSSWLKLMPGTTSVIQRVGDPKNDDGNPKGDKVTVIVRYTDSYGYTADTPPINIEIKRRPVDIVFVLDRSGSMAWQAETGSDKTRWYFLKEGVASILNWIRKHNYLNENDRFGLVYFSTDIVQAIPLRNFSSNLLNDIQADLNNRSPSGDTGMGAGIATALNLLCGGRDNECGNSGGTYDNRSKIAILVTDGDQNRKPGLYTTEAMSQINSTEFESQAETVISSTTLRNWINDRPFINFEDPEFGNGNYKISTIALTENVSPSTLEHLINVSRVTKGNHDATISSLRSRDEFSNFAEAFFGTMISALQGGSPQIVDNRKRRLPPGGSGEEIFQINGRVESVSFLVNSNPETMQRLQVRLFNGTQEFIPAQPFVKVSNGDTYSIITVSFRNPNGQQTVNPEGEWRIRVQGQADDYFEVMAIVDEHYFDFECYLQNNVILAGNNLTFQTKLDYAGAPVHDMVVTAQILGPTEDLPTLVSNTPTPSGIRSWLQTDYTFNLELYNQLGIKMERPQSDIEFTVYGKALDEKGAPIAGATIGVRDKNNNTVTDKNGKYNLSNIRIGDRLILTKDNKELKDVEISHANLVSGRLLFDWLVSPTTPTVDPILANILKFDPGLTPAEVKVEYLIRTGLYDSKIQLQPNIYRLIYRGDGRYSIPYSGNQITGSHKILYRISGDIPGIGRVDRYTSNSAVVKFGLLNIKNSHLTYDRGQILEGFVRGHLITKPEDQFGNLLGLGMGYNIRIEAIGHPSFKLGPFVDRLDGSYVFPVSYRETDGIPNVRVVVDEQEVPLYDGNLDQIPSPETENKFKLPIALGVAIPTGKFADLYDPGVMAELKIGIPLTRNKKLNLNAEGGFYSFDQKPQTDAFQILGGALGLRYDLVTILGGDVFVDANPLGYYKPSNADGVHGMNVGAGIFWKVFTPQVSIGLEGSYFNLRSNPDPITFLGVGVGLRLNIGN